VACSPIFGELETTCERDEDCAPGELCGDGACFVVLPVCVPQCNSNADCGAGLVCDVETGLCGETAATGKVVGEACTQVPDGEEDECRGTCIGLLAGENPEPAAYMCTESCTVEAIPSCGWGGPNSAQRAEAGCLFSSSAVSSAGGPAPGDRGSCGRLCDCNQDCLNPNMVCVGNPFVRSRYRRAGYCTTGVADDGGVERGIPSCAVDAGVRDTGPG
jgi:hypothetical protein